MESLRAGAVPMGANSVHTVPPPRRTPACLSCVIDAMECRDIATVDIPGAFMQQADMDETVHVKLKGKIAKLLVIIDPKLYHKHAQSDRNGKANSICRVVQGAI
jgi:hypothetical protein